MIEQEDITNAIGVVLRQSHALETRARLLRRVFRGTAVLRSSVVRLLGLPLSLVLCPLLRCNLIQDLLTMLVGAGVFDAVHLFRLPALLDVLGEVPLAEAADGRHGLAVEGLSVCSGDELGSDVVLIEHGSPTERRYTVLHISFRVHIARDMHEGHRDVAPIAAFVHTARHRLRCGTLPGEYRHLEALGKMSQSTGLSGVRLRSTYLGDVFAPAAEFGRLVRAARACCSSDAAHCVCCRHFVRRSYVVWSW